MGTAPLTRSWLACAPVGRTRSQATPSAGSLAALPAHPPVLLAFAFLLSVKEFDAQGRAQLWLVLPQGLRQIPEALCNVSRAGRPLQPGDHLLGMPIPRQPVCCACGQYL